MVAAFPLQGRFATRLLVGSAHPWGLDIFSTQEKRVPSAVRILIGVGVGIGIGIEGQKMRPCWTAALGYADETRVTRLHRA
jgi:hypothetical protein